jgi:hypothetical protein
MLKRSLNRLLFRLVVGQPIPLCDHTRQSLTFKFVVSLASCTAAAASA